MRSDRVLSAAVLLGTALAFAGAARADVDLSGPWAVLVDAPFTSGTVCTVDVVHTGTTISGSGSCSAYGAVTFSGTADPSTGAFSATGAVGSFCPSLTLAAASATATGFVAPFSCSGGPIPVDGQLVGSRCGNGAVDFGETCDRSVDGPSCCSDACTPFGAGMVCLDDPSGVLCITGRCNATGQCAFSPRTGSCEDFNPCTGPDRCAAGACIGTPRPSGDRCDLDADQCTTDVCDGAGACVPGGCSACCNDGAGCTPAPAASCIGPVVPKAQLKFKSGKIAWKLKQGDATTLGDFGDPTAATGYAFCMYNGDDELIGAAELPAGGACGSRPCWRSIAGRGFKYRDRLATPDGIDGAGLTAGIAGRTKVDVQGKQVALGGRLFPLPVRVQLKAGSGTCWQSVHSQGKFVSFGVVPGIILDKQGSPSGAFVEGVGQ